MCTTFDCQCDGCAGSVNFGNLRNIPAGEKTEREAPGLTNYVAICWLDTDLMWTKGVNRDAN